MTVDEIVADRSADQCSWRMVHGVRRRLLEMLKRLTSEQFERRIGGAISDYVKRRIGGAISDYVERRIGGAFSDYLNP